MLIGVYYDDPETVPEEKLCYAVGVVMAQSE
jgi:DNA gyrase inhibitor GyrI